MYGWMMGGAGAWWIAWLLVPLLIVAVVVVLVVTLTRRGTGGTSGGPGTVPPPHPSARAILDERYARGDIDHEEYIRRRDELGRSGS